MGLTQLAPSFFDSWRLTLKSIDLTRNDLTSLSAQVFGERYPELTTLVVRAWPSCRSSLACLIVVRVYVSLSVCVCGGVAGCEKCVRVVKVVVVVLTEQWSMTDARTTSLDQRQRQ